MEKVYLLFYKDEVLSRIQSFDKPLEEIKQRVKEFNTERKKENYVIVEDELCKHICSLKISEREEYKENVNNFKNRLDEISSDLNDLYQEIHRLNQI